MRVLLAGLLTGGLIATGATPASARPQPHPERSRTPITARLAPPVVTVGEPSALVAQLPASQRGRPVSVQALADGSWTELTDGAANAAGRTVVPLDTTEPGTLALRVVAPRWRRERATTSAPVTLKVLDTAACVPQVPLVDPEATAAARCLAARLDRWRGGRLMGVGQQLNMSNDQYSVPLTALGSRRVSVVGFDLWELGKTLTYEFPFFDRAFADLVALARGGAVLTASWHAPNPHTGRDYDDRSWHSLEALLEPTAPEAETFWAAFDQQLGVLSALQDQGVAVVLRPFHEANGDWFWWGEPSVTTFRAVWREMQDRAWAAGVHNVVWAYSFAARARKGITAPERLLPPRVDLAGIDTYYPATGSHRSQVPSMDGYAAVAKRVPRMAFTEIGPSADTARRWRPSVITTAAREQARRPVWALLWVDDAAGFKQISSLRGGVSWLDSCPFGYCAV